MKNQETKKENEAKVALFSKKQKICLAILIPLLFIAIAITVIAKNEYEHLPKNYTFPNGSLQNNLFAAQNTTYVANENFVKQHLFKSIKYVIDIPDTQMANVYNATFLSQESGLFYITETTKDSFTASVKKELSNIYFNQDLDLSIEVNVNNQGYINGYSATYMGMVARKDTIDILILGYLIEIDSSHCIFIGATTKEESSLPQWNQNCVSLINTLRVYDQDETSYNSSNRNNSSWTTNKGEKEEKESSSMKESISHQEDKEDESTSSEETTKNSEEETLPSVIQNDTFYQINP